MQQLTTFKYRIYPNEQQKVQLAQFFGAKRWVYNHFLAKQKELYATEKKHLSHFDMNYQITDLKKQTDTKWLKEVDAILLQNTTEDLSTAYRNFFASISGKRKGKKAELPCFKKRSNQQSYRTRNIKITDIGIKLPKFKTEIKWTYHRKIPDHSVVKTATISKTPSGKYFVSILVDSDVVLKSMSNREVGIDLGIKDLIITSDGIKFQNPNTYLAKTKQILKKKQQQLSRKKRGSNHYEKKRVQIARQYEKITNYKKNYYQNISNWLVTNYDAIYVEDLNVSGMTKNRKLSRAIHDLSWSTLSSMIEYKCDWYGKTYYKINRWTPSSKTCSCCGDKLDSLDLGTREWTCSACGAIHDRDINAAQNIKNAGQNDLYGKKITSTATEEGVEIPMALMKMTDKTERSSNGLLVGHGIEQA